MALVTVKEAALVLGISERGVRKRIEQGKLQVKEWVESNKGRGGKMALLDLGGISPVVGSASVEQSTNSPPDSSLVEQNTKELTKVLKNSVSTLVTKTRNKQQKGAFLWLSFGEVLALYLELSKSDKEAVLCLNDTKVLACPQTDVTKVLIEDTKTGTKELLPSTTAQKLEDKNFGAPFVSVSAECPKNEQLLQKNTKVLPNLEDIFLDTKELTEDQKDWRSTAEFKRLRRDIDNNLVISRKDPSDCRRTQILFSSLAPAYQSLWRLKKVPAVSQSDDSVVVGSLVLYNNVKEEVTKGQVNASVKQQLMSGLETVPANERWNIIDEFCKHYKTNRVTVWRWWTAYNQAGKSLGVLERKRSSKLGKRSIDDLDHHIKERFWYLVAAHPKRNCQYAATIIENEFGTTLTKGQIYELKKDKQGAIYLNNLVKHYPHLARFCGNFFVPQDRTQTGPLEVVTSDGHDCDIMVWHPITKQPFRPVLVSIYDAAAGITLGWALGDVENLQLCNMALIDAVCKFGWFKNLAVDCGKAFWKSDERRRRIYDMLGISVVSKQGYTPQAKAHQERSFGEFERNVCQLLPGYVGNSVKNKTRHTVSQATKAVLSFDEFREKVSHYFTTIEPHIKQSGLGGLSGAEYWQKCQSERKFKLKMFPGETKDLLKAFTIALGEETSVIVRRSMIAFSVNKVKYFFHNALLSTLETERVKIIYNINTIDNDNPPAVVYIFKNNRFLCEAEKVVRAGVGVVPEQQLRMKQETKAIRRQFLNDPMWNQESDLFKLQLSTYPQISFTPEAEVADVSDTELDALMPQLQGIITPVKNEYISEDVQQVDIYKEVGLDGMDGLFEQ